MLQQQNQSIHQTSLYSQVTDRIISELEQSIVPWVQPWGRDGGSAGLGLPRNARTAKAYSGINILLLWDAVIRGGYVSQSWLTFKQALELGGCVRKGEKGWSVCYADSFIPKNEKERASQDGGDPQSIDYARENDPFSKIGTRSVTVEIASVVRASPTSFQLRWREKAFENGTSAGVTGFTGVLTIVMKPPRDAATLRANPLGIYVNAINWANELKPEGTHP